MHGYDHDVRHICDFAQGFIIGDANIAKYRTHPLRRYRDTGTIWPIAVDVGRFGKLSNSVYLTRLAVAYCRAVTFAVITTAVITTKVARYHRINR